MIHANHLCSTVTDNATVIDLIEFVSPRTITAGGAYQQMNHVGITRMAFEVDDTDAIHAALQQRGDIQILAEPKTVPAPTGGSFRILPFKDPHGIVLELIEHRPPSTDEQSVRCDVMSTGTGDDESN